MWRRRLAELSLLTAESTVLFMVAAALAAAAGGGGPSFLAVWAATLGGFYLVRFLLHFDTGRPALILTGITLTVLALLVIGNLQYDGCGGCWTTRTPSSASTGPPSGG
jgi:hypothetical protein